MYEVLFSSTARKKLKKLPKKIQDRVVSALERIRVRPEKHVRLVVGSNYYRLRVGDYRVILDLKKDKLLVLVITIKHRKKAYKK